MNYYLITHKNIFMKNKYKYKPYSLQLKEYECEKQKLIDQCVSCEDYEKAVQELAETLDI